MDRGDKNALEASAAPSKSNTDKKDNDKGKLPNSKKDGKSDANNSKVRDIGNVSFNLFFEFNLNCGDIK